jgi:hypothetical protein
MTNPATKQQIIQSLTDELGEDHPLMETIKHGYLHLPPAHIDILDGQLRVWREDDTTFSASFYIKENMLKDINDIVMSVISQIDFIK